MFYTREIPTGPSSVNVHRLVVVANESYPFILGLVLREEALPNRIVLQRNEFDVIATVRHWEQFQSLADEIQEALGKFELQIVRQSENIGEPLGGGQLTEMMVTKLSDDQLAILETAYNMGYFDVPREASATDIATELNIAQSTMSERLRVVEQNLFELIYGPREE